MYCLCALLATVCSETNAVHVHFLKGEAIRAHDTKAHAWPAKASSLAFVASLVDNKADGYMTRNLHGK